MVALPTAYICPRHTLYAHLAVLQATPPRTRATTTRGASCSGGAMASSPRTSKSEGTKLAVQSKTCRWPEGVARWLVRCAGSHPGAAGRLAAPPASRRPRAGTHAPGCGMHAAVLYSHANSNSLGAAGRWSATATSARQVQRCLAQSDCTALLAAAPPCAVIPCGPPAGRNSRTITFSGLLQARRLPPPCR